MATDEAKARIAAARKKAAKQGGTPRLVGCDADASVEYARTVDAVDWLVRHSDERQQIEKLAGQLADLGAETLKDLGGGRTARLRLADHVWCDAMASLVVALNQVQDLEAKLKDSFAETVAELSEHAWEAFVRSRETSYGRRPNSRAELPRSTRGHRDVAAGLDKAIVKGAVRGVVKVALESLTAGGDLQLRTILFKLRLSATLLCPDPSAHQVVWDECVVPLVNLCLRSEIQEQLTIAVEGFDSPMNWDTTRESDGDGASGNVGGRR